jgi:tetraacyldisaccharide 4'-kinase
MSVFKFLLLPFAMIYDLVMDIRNRMYDLEWKPSVSFDLPVISVGNLVMGGSGKTPMVEHLIRILTPQYKVVSLSRGYGRKTKGFKIAQAVDTASTLGDEPLQIYRKFSDFIQVAVGEDRAHAIPMILQEFPETEVVVLDDAYQHRRVKPGLSILLTEYNNPFYNDNVLPYGRLREGPEGASRADIIVVTKCPPQLEEEIMSIEKQIRKYSSKPVFFSKIRYADAIPFGVTHSVEHEVILVSAIANARVLEDHVQKSYSLLKHFEYRDHYNYTLSDVKEWESFLKKHPDKKLSILTTEKDKVKLERNELTPVVSKLPIFYLPIETEFLRNGKDFDTLILSFVNGFKHTQG